ncbi:MAG: methylenetetrahydrofolate--tRNA-(uracil(54)-C(5))-methyltransferase (FADH(2)-oxidizing) TrmFO [Christensenellaceae bacterium]|jgi:methylenetetrahydrofolate--tRNA-(uracil-5-)-methyltransferase|nr:methylenetetrahydrofolate--tRNA-(uracil(54)-C(5))-methyltransferase (FADH(2)-oxidizing) TrmFO [Christensenellaceae bacterium]
MKRAIVVGAGLAGSEAAWQLAKRGVEVELHEMKPQKYSPAHSMEGFAELVCSNSLRSNRLENAVGLLKEEMRRLGSLILEAADQSAVPAGGSLAVDRSQFSGYITQKLSAHPLVRVRREEVSEIPEGHVVIASGPLTGEPLAGAIERLTGQGSLSFYDAAAPIVRHDSIDQEKTFRASRYGRGEDDYINCPMNKEEYDRFYDALISAETAEVHGFEGKEVFEGCMPVEVMAARGRQTLCFGPLKPKGLVDPATGRMPYAVLQLRQDDAAGSLYNLVGFQTRLKFGEQKRVFSMIPGLERAVFLRYGVMHRNTFLNSPGLLDSHYRLREGLYFAGQMTGVEGYVESAASGLLAGLSLARDLEGAPRPCFGPETAIGSMGLYVSAPNRHFQPMNANFGIMAPLEGRIRDKRLRYLKIAERALARVDEIAKEL